MQSLTKLNYGFVKYVIKQLGVLVNQTILILKHIYSKKNVVSLLKNKKFLNQKLEKKNICLKMLVKSVDIIFSILLNIYVFMIWNF